MEKARTLLKEGGVELASKKLSREAHEGIVISYMHHNKRMGSMLILNCETDFVARNEEFQKLGYEIAMQVASMQPKTTDELLAQSYIRDSSKTIDQLIKELISKLGENIKVGEFVRLAL